MPLIVFNQFIFIIICVGFGILFCKIFNLKKIFLHLNIFDISLFGLMFMGFLGQLVNFFFPLNDIFLLTNLILSILLIFYFFKEYKFLFFLDKKFILITLATLTLTYFTIFGSGYSDDLNHYHYAYINTTDNLKYILGLNFLHPNYGFSPIWLIVNSSLNFESSRLQDIHITNSLPYFFILSSFLIKIFQDIEKKNFNILTILKIFFISFILLKYTRLKEYGVDRSIIIFFIYFIYLFIYFWQRYFLKISLENKKNIFYIILLISIFIFSNKIVYFPIFIFAAVMIYSSEKKVNYFYDLKIILMLIPIASYILKNIFLSGCIIYPLPFMCIDILPWNSKEIASNYIVGAEVMNKSMLQYTGNLDSINYVKNFNWVETWFERTKVELFEFTILFTFIFAVTCFLFNAKKNKKKRFLNKIKLLNFTFFIAFLSFFFLIFLNTPLIRLSHHVFLIFFLLPFLFLPYYNFSNKILLKENYFIFFLTLFFLFSFTKNVNRISSNNFINSPLDSVKNVGWYSESKARNLDGFNYYSNWGKAPVANMLNKNIYGYKKIFTYDIIFKK